MKNSRFKKQYGQHFLKDQNTAKRICANLQLAGKTYTDVLEIGPGGGVLTQNLIEYPDFRLWVVEVDEYWAKSLKEQYPQLQQRLFQSDVLTFDWSLLERKIGGEFGIIGNFPYNIASQIILKMLDYASHIPELVGMFQWEVVQRLTAQPANKQFGMLSVLLQSYYKVERLFKISPGAFHPPPKVQSGVISAVRKEADFPSDLDYPLFFQIVKTAFQQRRKKLSNALSTYKAVIEGFRPDLLEKRPEEVYPAEYQAITRQVEKAKF